MSRCTSQCAPALLPWLLGSGKNPLSSCSFCYLASSLCFRCLVHVDVHLLNNHVVTVLDHNQYMAAAATSMFP